MAPAPASPAECRLLACNALTKSKQNPVTLFFFFFYRERDGNVGTECFMNLKSILTQLKVKMNRFF